jgi:cyclic beta-1,2-glucan synthetase
MDFPTRDRYRHAVEALARHGRLTGGRGGPRGGCAGRRGGGAKGPATRAAHVGYHLIDGAPISWSRLAQVRWPWRAALERAIRRRPLACYVGGILLLTLLATAASGHLRRLCHLPAGWTGAGRSLVSCWAPVSWRWR